MCCAKARLGILLLGLMVGGEESHCHQNATAHMGPDIQSVLEKAELKDRDFFLRRKLKFGQETGTNPPMLVKFTQRGFRLFWVLLCAC